MHTRNLILTVLGTGIFFGAIAGFSVNTTMKPPPAPHWHHLSGNDQSSTASYRFVDSGPQDLSPWSEENTPTWKRRQEFRTAAYDPLSYSKYPADPEADLAVPATSQPVQIASSDEAAQIAEVADIDARTAVDGTYTDTASKIDHHAEERRAMTEESGLMDEFLRR